MRRIVSLVGLASLVVLVFMSSHASGATIYSQSNLLRGPDAVYGPCAGLNKGKCTIAEQASVGTSPTAADNVKVTCVLKNAQPSTTFQVFWVATTIARGCHSNSAGFVSLGTVTTSSTGTAKFVVTKGNNPFPGFYVHLDLCPGTTGGCTAAPLYASVFAGIPIGVGPAAPTVDNGDPSSIK